MRKLTVALQRLSFAPPIELLRSRTTTTSSGSRGRVAPLSLPGAATAAWTVTQIAVSHAESGTDACRERADTVSGEFISGDSISLDEVPACPGEASFQLIFYFIFIQ